MIKGFAHSLQVRTLRARDTITTRRCDDLKLDNPDGTRWWLCHLDRHSDHRVTVEEYKPSLGMYTIIETYADPEDK